MIKRIFSIALISLSVVSCTNKGKKDVVFKNSGSERGNKVEFAMLTANPDTFIGKTIFVEGKVVHICTETGKKMFIVGENPDMRLYVAAGENISKFPMELLGSEIVVEGLIKKAGGPSIGPSEKPGKEIHDMHKDTMKSETMGRNSCETETALAGQPSLANIIMEYRSHTLK